MNIVFAIILAAISIAFFRDDSNALGVIFAFAAILALDLNADGTSPYDGSDDY